MSQRWHAETRKRAGNGTLFPRCRFRPRQGTFLGGGGRGRAMPGGARLEPGRRLGQPRCTGPL